MKKFTFKLWAVLLLMLVSLQTFATDNEYGLKDNIQDGVILHCFDWTYAQIKEELPNIAAEKEATCGGGVLGCSNFACSSS